MNALSFLLVGTPRSGTTLVQRLCCELPGVVMPPETHFLQLFAPDLLGRRRFPLRADEVAEELRRFEELPTSRGLRLDHERVRALLGPCCGSLVELFSAVVVALCPPRPPAAVYGEKTPEHLLWWRAMTTAVPHLRLVGVVRDPRGVAASHRAVPWGIHDPVELAEEWAFDQRQLLAARRRLGPDRCLVLRYEDVVAAPDAAQDRLARLLLRRLPSRQAASLQLAAHRDAAGSAAPAAGRRIVHDWEWWKARALEPVTAQRADAWREVLSPQEAAAVAVVARREMAAFGYDAAATRGAVDDRPGRTEAVRAARSRLAARLRRMRHWEALVRA